MLEPDNVQTNARRAETWDDRLDPSRPKPLFGIGSFIRHRRLIGACGLAFLLLAGVVAVVKPTRYTASTQLLVYNRELLPGAEAVILKGRADVSLVQNEIEIAQSRSVLTRVVEALNLDKPVAQPTLLREVIDTLGRWLSRPTSGPSSASQGAVTAAAASLSSRLSVRRVGTSHAISIAITDPDPVTAAQTANEVARAYIQARVVASGPEATRDLALRERLQGLGPNAYVISPAEPPQRPDGPKAWLILLAGLVAGLGIGGALALVLDFTDHTIRTPEQAEFVLGLECLGAVRDLACGERQQGSALREDLRRYLAMLRKPEWARVRERLRQRSEVRNETAMRMMRGPNERIAPALRRAAALIAMKPQLASIGITSAGPGEGVTTIAANLACQLAGEGRKVLLLDAVPRAASHASPPGLPSSLGVRAPARSASSPHRAAAGDRTWPDIVCAGLPSIESDAAWKAALDARLRDAAKTHDLVVVDLPALADGANVRLAAPSFDAFILVVKWGDTDSELVQQALHSSGKARSRFIGVMLNFVDDKLIGTYGDKLAAMQMALAVPDSRLDRLTADAPATLPAGNATKAKA